jgi:hypothetical protein
VWPVALNERAHLFGDFIELVERLQLATQGLQLVGTQFTTIEKFGQYLGSFSFLRRHVLGKYMSLLAQSNELIRKLAHCGIESRTPLFVIPSSAKG